MGFWDRASEAADRAFDLTFENMFNPLTTARDLYKEFREDEEEKEEEDKD